MKKEKKKNVGSRYIIQKYKKGTNKRVGSRDLNKKDIERDKGKKWRRSENIKIQKETNEREGRHGLNKKCEERKERMRICSLNTKMQKEKKERLARRDLKNVEREKERVGRRGLNMQKLT